MIVVKLQGGLGNQMFQYAIGKLMADDQGVDLFFDMSFFDYQEKRLGFTPRKFELDIFNPKYQIAEDLLIRSFFKETRSRQIRKFLGISYKKKYKEDICKFDESILSLSSPVYLDGYFQSQKYFTSNESLIKKLFIFPSYLNEHLEDIIQSIEISNSVAVHFRRGDYVNDEITANFHGVCSLSYYQNAFKFLSEKLVNPHYFIFSDDIEWVKQKVKGWATKITFVSGLYAVPSWVDMMLMSKCSHNIIANSSFSWWGAWLNYNPQKIVIAPNRWFNDESIITSDIICNSWITM
jgi:hypothetical protein